MVKRSGGGGCIFNYDWMCLIGCKGRWGRECMRLDVKVIYFSREGIDSERN